MDVFVYVLVFLCEDLRCVFELGLCILLMFMVSNMMACLEMEGFCGKRMEEGK